jgi:hypothetical protein
LAWGNQSHEIISIIAADNLSPAAREQVAKILGTPSDVDFLEDAMAASIRPDTPKEEARSPYSVQCPINRYEAASAGQ